MLQLVSSDVGPGRVVSVGDFAGRVQESSVGARRSVRLSAKECVGAGVER